MATNGQFITLPGVDPVMGTAIFANSAQRAAERTAKITAESSERMTEMQTTANVDIASKQAEAAIKGIMAQTAGNLKIAQTQETGATERVGIETRGAQDIAKTNAETQKLIAIKTALLGLQGIQTQVKGQTDVAGIQARSAENIADTGMEGMLKKAGIDANTAQAIAALQGSSQENIARITSGVQERISALSNASQERMYAGELRSKDLDRQLTERLQNVSLEDNKVMLKLKQDFALEAHSMDTEAYNGYVDKMMTQKDKVDEHNHITSLLGLLGTLSSVNMKIKGDATRTQMAMEAINKVLGQTENNTAANITGLNHTSRSMLNDKSMQEALNGIVDERMPELGSMGGGSVGAVGAWNQTFADGLKKTLSEATGGRIVDFSLPTDPGELEKVRPQDIVQARMVLSEASRQLKNKIMGLSDEDNEKEIVDKFSQRYGQQMNTAGEGMMGGRLEEGAGYGGEGQAYLNTADLLDFLPDMIAENNPISLWGKLKDFVANPMAGQGSLADETGTQLPYVSARRQKELREISNNVEQRLASAQVQNILRKLSFGWNNLTVPENKAQAQLMSEANDAMGKGPSGLLVRAAQGSIDTETGNPNQFNLDSIIAAVTGMLQEYKDNGAFEKDGNLSSILKLTNAF